MTAAGFDAKSFYDNDMNAFDEQDECWRNRFGLKHLDYAAHLAIRLGSKWLNNAMNAYQRVFLLTNEDLLVIHKNLVTHYRKKGDLGRSIEYLEKVVEAEEGAKKSKLTLTLGELYYLNNDLERAKSMLQNHLVAHPDASKALVGLANIYVKLKDDDRAIEYYERAVKIDDQNHYAFYRLGILCDKRKDLLKATEWLTCAIMLDPDNIRYNQALGFVYEALGDHAKAIPYFKRVMEIESER